MTTNTDDTTDFISRMSGGMVQQLVDSYKIHQGNRLKLFQYIHKHNLSLEDIKFTLAGSEIYVDAVVAHKLIKEPSLGDIVPDNIAVAYTVECYGFSKLYIQLDDCPFINFKSARLEYANRVFSIQENQEIETMMLQNIIYNSLQKLEIFHLKCTETKKLQVLLNATIIQDDEKLEFIIDEDFLNDIGFLTRFGDKYEIDYVEFRKPKLDAHIVKVEHKLTAKNKIIYVVTWDTNCQTRFNVRNFLPSRLEAFYIQFGCRNEQEFKEYAIKLRAEGEMVANEVEVQFNPKIAVALNTSNGGVQKESENTPILVTMPTETIVVPSRNHSSKESATISPQKPVAEIKTKPSIGNVKPLKSAESTITKELPNVSQNVPNVPKSFNSSSIPAILQPAYLKQIKPIPPEPNTPTKVVQKLKPNSSNFSNFKTDFDNMGDDIIDLCASDKMQTARTPQNDSFIDLTKDLPFPEVAQENQMEFFVDNAVEDVTIELVGVTMKDLVEVASPILNATISSIKSPLDNKLPAVSSLLDSGVISPPVMSNSTSSASLAPTTNLFLKISFSVCSLPRPSFSTTLPVNLDAFDSLNIPNKIHLTDFCPLTKLHKLELLDFLPIPNIKEDCLAYINSKDAFIAFINGKIVALSANKDKECGFLFFKGNLKLQDPWRYSTFINDTCDLSQPEIWQIEYFSKTVFSKIFEYFLGNLQMHELAWTNVVVFGNSQEMQIFNKYVTTLIAHCSSLVEKKEKKKLLIIEKDCNFQHLVTNGNLNIHSFDTMALLEITNAKNGYNLTNSEPFLFIHSSVSVDRNKYKSQATISRKHPKLTAEYCGIYGYCLKHYAKCAFIVTNEDSELFKFSYFKRINEDEIPLEFVK